MSCNKNKFAYTCESKQLYMGSLINKVRFWVADSGHFENKWQKKEEKDAGARVPGSPPESSPTRVI